MTSSNTVIADNPAMEHRCKCILDTNSRVPKKSKIFEQGKVYVATKDNTGVNKEGKLNIKSVLSELYKKGIYTVFVECGGTLAGSMIKEVLIDEVYQFIAPKILNDNSGKSCFDGSKLKKISEAKNLKIYSATLVGQDLLVKCKVL